MPNKLPADFDPDWYAASYPDVALSGLSPREHYLRFGSLLGRAARGTGQPKPEPTKPAPKLVKTPPRPAAVPVPPKVQPPSPPPMPKPATPSPIIERPAGFDPLAAVPKPAAPREGSVFSLDTVANLPGPDPRNAAVSDAIYAYARLLRVDEPGGVSKAEASLSCGASTFQTGPSRLDNAWLVCPRRLRLMLAGHEERAEEINGLAVRAYQADPASPGEFRLLGQGVQLPPHGPVLHDVELQHPLMPLVLELSDAGGVTRGLSLLPFPSLLPGGLHGAELKALQTEPNPIDDFWAFSEALLREAVGRDGSPARSVARVSVAGEGTALDQAALTSEVQEWLTTVIGLGLEATNDPADQGLQLLLPPDCVPTISALVTRGLEVSGTGALIGPYLVAEAGTYRPRWSIVLPADVEPGTAIPLLRRGNSAADAAPSR